MVSFLWSLCLAALQLYPGSLPGALLMIAVAKSWERRTSFLYLQWESWVVLWKFWTTWIPRIWPLEELLSSSVLVRKLEGAGIASCCSQVREDFLLQQLALEGQSLQRSPEQGFGLISQQLPISVGRSLRGIFPSLQRANIEVNSRKYGALYFS